MKKMILLLSLCALFQGCGQNSATKGEHKSTNYFPNALVGTDEINLNSEPMFYSESEARSFLINDLDKTLLLNSIQFTLLESARDFHSVYLCGFEPKNKDLHRAFKKVQSALEMVYHDELMNPASTKKIAFDEWHPSQRILVNELYKFIGLILKKNGPVWEKNPDVVCKTHTIEYRRTKKDIQNSMKQDKFNELDAEKELLSFSQDKRSIRVSKSIENLLSLDICPLSGPKNQEVKNLIPRLKESLDILYPEKRDSMMHFALKEADKLIPADNNACVNRTVTVVRECHDGVCEFVVQ